MTFSCPPILCGFVGRRWKPPFEDEKLAKLYVAASYDQKDEHYMTPVKEKLQNLLGKIDFELKTTPILSVPSQYISNKEFEHFHILSFEKLILREELVIIKTKILRIENGYQKEGFPVVELDVGYVTDKHVIRTSLFEDYYRIYLYKKIYAETLYYYEKDSYKPFIHTPKFFRNSEIITLYNDLRLIYVHYAGI